MFKKWLFVIACLPAFSLPAQDRIKLDSLVLQLENVRSDTLKINTLLEITKYYQGVDYSKAIKYAKEALELALDKGREKHEAKALRAMGLIYYYMGDYKNATGSYFKILPYYEQARDTAGLVAIYNNLGAVFDRLTDFDKALVYYFKARDLLTHYSQMPLVNRVLPSLFNNIGNIYQTKKEIDAAIEYYEKSLALATEVNNKTIQGVVLNNLGKLYLYDRVDLDKSIDYLQRGLTLRLEVGDKFEVSKSYNLLAHYYRERGDYPTAKEMIEKSISLSKEIGSLEQQKFAYFSLSEIEKDRGKYKEALEAFTTFKQLNDSIQSQVVSSEINRLQMTYDYEKAEQLHLREQKQARDRYIAIVIILAVCLVLAILVAILIRLKSKQTELRRKNLTLDVEIKNKELTTNVMYLVRKNELINDVAERLLKVQPNLLPENRKVVQSVILDLQREVDNDTWKEFEMRFNQVHSDFYTHLREQYPDLSPAEEKLCAFLRLNMSSKEIAAITQQSIKSVEVARARLRKKLNLTNTTSNLITHLSHI